MKKFFAPVRHTMKLPGQVSELSGGIVFASGIKGHALIRRDVDKHAYLKAYRLLDPQIYLSGLQASTCPMACVNLASHGWFPLNKPLRTYRSSRHRQREWAKQALAEIGAVWTGSLPKKEHEIRDLIRNCVTSQMGHRCGMLILPSPLVSEAWMGFGEQANWLDIGIGVAKIYNDVPFVTTIALTDGCLRSTEPSNNRLIDQIADQVSARSPHGAYVVVEQSNEENIYCTSERTLGALLRLVRLLKLGGVSEVIVAFAGTAGLLTLAAGADAWTTGWYRKERRLRFKDFEDEGNEGPAFPTYYSHSLGGEIGLEKDLDFLVSKGLLPELNEVTEASKGLGSALAAGESVKSVPEWEHRKSNVAAARWHFLAVCARETARLSSMSSTECATSLQNWLRQADELAGKVRTLTPPGGFERRTSLTHQCAWRKAFNIFLDSEFE